MTKGRVIVAVAAVAVLLAWIVPSMDRANRSQPLSGITSAAAVHVSPDGRLVVTEYGDAGAPEGRVLIVDPRDDRREVVFDGLWRPWGADMDADGTVCVALEGPPPGKPELRCSDGRTIDLSERGVGTAADAGVRPQDVVWDGGTGWFVADAGTPALLHVDTDGAVETVARFESRPGRRETPQGLTRSTNGTVWLALGKEGLVVVKIGSPSPPSDFGYVGGDVVVAVIPRTVGAILLYQNDDGTATGRVAWCCGVEGQRTTILDGLLSPRGLALLPDGRLAVSANGQVTLYRPDSLPGS